MNDAKRIPYGVSNFVEVVEQNQYYVDKTMYLPLAVYSLYARGVSAKVFS